MAFVTLAAVVMLHASDWSAPSRLKWDGLRYNGLVREYVDAGYSLSRVSGAAVAGEPHPRAYLNRVLYIVLLGQLHHVTGVELAILYRAVSIAGFALAALGLYALARRAGAAALGAFFAGAWLILNPGAYIVFEVGAHPDAMAIAFAAGALWAHRAGRHGLSAILIGIGTLAKPTAAFVAPYAILGVLSGAPPARRRAWLLAAQYGIAALAGLLVPYALVPAAPDPGTASTLPVLLAFTQKRALQSLLYNFDVLWLVWGAALVHTSRAERMRLFAVGGILMVSLFGLADWWRVPYGVLAVFVLPAAAAFLADRFDRTIGPVGVWCVFAGITALLLRLPARFEWNAIESYTTWPFLVVAAALALNEGWLRARALSTD